MKKINIPLISIVLLLSVVGIIAIQSYESQQKKNTLPKEPMELQQESDKYYLNYKTYTLNGCEYIVVGTAQFRWGSHKGDCKNPIHYTK
jgi:Tfp pilus assembly protein PilE